MKTNLIFKRNVEGKIEMKVVSVDISLPTNEGWQLASWCDSIDITDADNNSDNAIEDSRPDVSTLEDAQHIKVTDNHYCDPGGKYQSNVSGSARLVRYKGKIIIAYRKGVKTYNQNTPNSVCISDTNKCRFFRDVKEVYGPGTSIWQLRAGDAHYDAWNQFIDETYEDGRVFYNNNIVIFG